MSLSDIISQDRIGVHPNDWQPSDDEEAMLRAVDDGIRPALRVMVAGRFETYESCQGGPGHAYTEPTIRFHGDRGEGFRALAWLRAYGIEPTTIRRMWTIQEGEPHGPEWEITFWSRDSYPKLRGRK